jgi:translin
VNLEPIRDSIRASLDAKNRAREQGLTTSRKVIRLSANAIRAVHRGDKHEAERLMDEAADGLRTAREAMADHPDIQYAGFFHDAAKEHAESKLTHALVFNLPFPTPEEIGVEAQAYLNGMGEAVGEMRRHLLDLMRHGEIERSDELLEAMDEIYYLLTSMDYPDAMTGGLRRTTDVARSIIERTRGDLSTTIIQHKLRTSLEEVYKQLPR